MDSVPHTVTAGEPPGESAAPGSDGASSLREAMLAAIGELSEDERARLTSSEQPDDLASAWRDLIAERAALEREQRVRAELTREFESQLRSARQRPTGGLRGGAPPPQPDSVAEWTRFIRDADGQELRQQRRAQFANWLAAHPEA